MTSSKLATLMLIVVGFSFQSCDPYYSIRIQNLTQDTVTVVARTTVNFHSNNIDYTVLNGSYDDQRIKFKILPHGYVDCGTAIGGLQDDLPFRELHIYTRQDSIVAASPTEVLNLFKTNLFGGQKTPYEIEIE